MKCGEVKYYLENIKEEPFLDRKWITADAHVYALPYPILATEGEHSLESCSNCRKTHKAVKKDVRERFKKFPECCNFHKGLNDLSDFSKKDFKNIDTQIADKTLFTYHHIINSIEDENWYVEIYDYLQYAIDSFGKMPKNCGEPFLLSNFRSYIQSLLNEFEADYKPKKIDLIDAQIRINKVIKILEQPKVENEATDYHRNTLFKTYEDWFRLFPFELSYFQHLKPKFSRVIPLQNGKSHYNKYLKTTFHESHTKESLSVVLINLTQKILTEINGLVLYEKGELKDANKIDLELLIKNRKIELNTLSLSPNETRADYVKILKDWFKGERKFIEGIKGHLAKEKDKQSTIKARKEKPTIPEYALYYFYLQRSKEIQYFENHPNGKIGAIDALIESGDIPTSRKYFQIEYNKISNHQTNRIARNKIKSIQYVIENMLSEYPKAKEIASSELKKIQNM